MKSVELAAMLGLPALPRYVEQVEGAMVAAVAPDSSALREPVLHLAHSGGKRLRPTLAYAAASVGGAARGKAVVTIGAALESAHLATLAHDDIMDDAEFRWGKPAVHVSAGVNAAILAGDYLLAQSVAQAAAVSGESAQVLARTIAEMCDGQSLELADAYNPDRTVAACHAAIRKKTAALMSAACRLGSMCAGLPPKHVAALAAYGEAFGMAFQLVDDLLDFVASPEAMGKPVGNDLKEGVYTLPVLLALQGPQAATVRAWLGRDAAVVPRSTVIDTLTQAGAFEQTLQEIARYNAQATTAIGRLPQTPVTAGLAKLSSSYLASALQKQTVLPMV